MEGGRGIWWGRERREEEEERGRVKRKKMVRGKEGRLTFSSTILHASYIY